MSFLRIIQCIYSENDYLHFNITLLLLTIIEEALKIETSGQLLTNLGTIRQYNNINI